MLALAVLLAAEGRRLPESMRLSRASIPKDAACPCANVSLCDAVTAQHAKEIFGFSMSGQWKYYPWNLVTTVAWDTSDPLIVCTAHANNARVIAAAPDPVPFSADPKVRAKYIQDALDMVRALHLDGITFDYERAIAWNAPERDYYTLLVTETTKAFRAAIPGSQISVCAAWSPDGIDGRAYDYAGLAAGSDFLYQMMYDTRSQIFEQCLAAANAALSITQRGIQRFFDMGIPPNKIVLGLPWYGYKYPCLPGTDPKAEYCPIPFRPFRGVNCSDAAGTEIEYAEIMRIVDSGLTSTPVRWDASTQTPYFNMVENGTVYQMHFDNPQSLALKYGYAKSLGLRGTGPFCFSFLDATGSRTGNPKGPQEAKEMWDALKTFL